MIPIQFERLTTTAKPPQYAHAGDAGADLFADRDAVLQPGEAALIPTGIKISIPLGYEAQVRPKSGLALKNSITVLNTPGTIDSGYRGELGVILINHSAGTFWVSKGMKIAQLVINQIEHADFQETHIDDDTQRGQGGFGSTGK